MHVRDMDHEHEEIYRLLVSLHAAAVNGAPGLALAAGAQEFLSTVQNHFEREEQLLQELLYPGYEKQKADHQTILRKLGQMLAALASSRDSAAVIVSAAKLLDDHVRGADVAYGEYLVDQGMV